MKISEILQKKVAVSFEIFPPKESTQFSGVLDAAERLSALKPDYMSVTYGAGGGTSANTVKIAGHIENKLGITALAHLTCVSSTPDEIGGILKELKSKNISNILALRGDIPECSGYPSPGSYRYAMELIGDIRREGGFCIGGACYPEGHVENPNKETDIGYLKKKVDSGCDFLVSQLFFDNNVFYNFLYRLFRNGINVPVVAGIMPVTNINSIRRMTKLSGAVLTPKYKAMLDKFEHNSKALMQAGIVYASEQIIDLISNGVGGIHIYTMNKPEIAESIMKNISHAVGGVLTD